MLSVGWENFHGLPIRLEDWGYKSQYLNDNQYQCSSVKLYMSDLILSNFKVNLHSSKWIPLYRLSNSPSMDEADQAARSSLCLRMLITQRFPWVSRTANTHKDLATCLRLSALCGLRTAHVWKSSRDSWIFPSRRNISAAKKQKTKKVKSCSGKNRAWYRKIGEMGDGKPYQRNSLDYYIFNKISWVETNSKVADMLNPFSFLFLRPECFIVRNTFTLTQLTKELSVWGVLHFPFIKEINMLKLKREKK